jgi:hypothetical protein
MRCLSLSAESPPPSAKRAALVLTVRVPIALRPLLRARRVPKVRSISVDSP